MTKILISFILFLFLATPILGEGFYTDYPKWREHKGWRNELKTMDYLALSQLHDALQHHMKINESTYSKEGKRKAEEELKLMQKLMKTAKVLEKIIAELVKTDMNTNTTGGPCGANHIWTSTIEVETGDSCDCGEMVWYEKVCPCCHQKVVEVIPIELYKILSKPNEAEISVGR